MSKTKYQTLKVMGFSGYDQTACLAAAAAQDAAEVGRSQDYRKCRNLTRKLNQTQARTNNSKRTSKQQSNFTKFIQKVINSFIQAQEQESIKNNKV